MNGKFTKIAAILTFIIGAMAIFAGGQVVLGKVMDYYVIDWLPLYNLIVGLISTFFIAIIIWKGSKIALQAAAVILVSHATVMLILQTYYRGVVASNSIRAMTIRITVWLIILALMIIQVRKDKRISNYGEINYEHSN
jgi:hypothetical protein